VTIPKHLQHLYEQCCTMKIQTDDTYVQYMQLADKHKMYSKNYRGALDYLVEKMLKTEEFKDLKGNDTLRLSSDLGWQILGSATYREFSKTRNLPEETKCS